MFCVTKFKTRSLNKIWIELKQVLQRFRMCLLSTPVFKVRQIITWPNEDKTICDLSRYHVGVD